MSYGKTAQQTDADARSVPRPSLSSATPSIDPANRISNRATHSPTATRVAPAAPVNLRTYGALGDSSWMRSGIEYGPQFQC